ncbi:hypothetical protein BH10ACT9_BH10ACT9_09170 [soil metagenome]
MSFSVRPPPAYDANGEKYQELDGFTCFGGTADTSSIVFQCASENGEFAFAQT